MPKYFNHYRLLYKKMTVAYKTALYSGLKKLAYIEIWKNCLITM